MIDIKNITGVKVYQSILSEHYFLGIYLDKTQESVANAIQFLVPNIQPEILDKIRTSDIDNDIDFLEMPINNEKTKVEYGSYIMRNMFGTSVVVTKHMLQSMFMEINDDTSDLIFVHTFRCMIVMNMFKLSDNKVDMNSMFIEVMWQTYKDYPEKKELLETVKTGAAKSNIELLEKCGYTLTFEIFSIQELTINQRLDYLANS